MSKSTPPYEIRVYNTLTRNKEPFETVVPGRAAIYLCGPTVYKEAHIGHMVGPVIFDAIKRYLAYTGYEVNWVVNITDVDDKIIAESQKRSLSMAEVAEENIADYMHNLAALGVDQIDQFPKATEHMSHIQEFILALVDRGFAYASEGDVYFEVGKDPNYGKLSNRSIDSLQGEGGEMASRKRAPGDFALWKKAREGEPSWNSPWGPGRPGWHIECSAMSHAILGETFDIHGGGLDLVFPHHENEVAQSECCHDKPMVKYWMHNGLMKAASNTGKVGGKAEREAAADGSDKISRSKGAGGLAQLIDEHGGELLRFFLLRTHYRSTIVFGQEGLQEASTSLDAFYRFFERYERITGQSFYDIAAPTDRASADATYSENEEELVAAVKSLRDSYFRKMDDDFNTGAAVSELFELIRTLNQAIDRSNLEDPDARTAEAVDALRRGTLCLRELTGVLGLFREAPAVDAAAGQELVGTLIELLIELRGTARESKNFEMADRIRDGLTEAGVTLEDSKGGTRWRLE